MRLCSRLVPLYRGCPSFVPLLYHNLGDLSRDFYIFSRTSKSCFNPVGKSCVPSVFLPLTMIVYHRLHQKSIGNNAQIREKKQAKVCVKCELIFFERCDIMEILPGAFDLGQPKQKERFYPLPISTSTSS